MRSKLYNYLGPEDRVHIAVCNYLKVRFPGAVVFHAPMEGKRTEFERFKMKLLGVRPGFPDLIILYQGKHLAIELKSEVGRPTPAQLLWIDVLRKQGWTAEVCKGFDEAKKVIDEFFFGKLQVN